MKFVATPFAARQLVNHGHVSVNGRRVNIASYQVKDNDAIELRSKAKEMAVGLESVKSRERDLPDYLQGRHDPMKSRFLPAPHLPDLPHPRSMETHPLVY